LTKKELEMEINFPIDGRTILVTFHPITLENNTSERYFSNLIKAIKKAQNIKVIFTYTNADTEGRIINEMIDKYVDENPKTSIAFSSLGQLKYISCLKYIGATVGNSSSGIIETPTFQTPTVNIGDRELGRVMAKNVICCSQDIVSIKNAINKSLSLEFKSSLKGMINPYEKKDTAVAIADILTKIEIPDSIKKTFYDLEQ